MAIIFRLSWAHDRLYFYVCFRVQFAHHNGGRASRQQGVFALILLFVAQTTHTHCLVYGAHGDQHGMYGPTRCTKQKLINVNI